MGRRRTILTEESHITEKVLFGVAKDLVSGRNPLKEVRLTDDLVTGLRFECLKDGTITVHAAYDVDGRRPMMKIGDLNLDSPERISLAEARHLTQVIRKIGAMGVDVQDGLRKRLIAELVRDGVNWRPALSPPAVPHAMTATKAKTK